MRLDRRSYLSTYTVPRGVYHVVSEDSHRMPADGGLSSNHVCRDSAAGGEMEVGSVGTFRKQISCHRSASAEREYILPDRYRPIASYPPLHIPRSVVFMPEPALLCSRALRPAAGC